MLLQSTYPDKGQSVDTSPNSALSASAIVRMQKSESGLGLSALVAVGRAENQTASSFYPSVDSGRVNRMPSRSRHLCATDAEIRARRTGSVGPRRANQQGRRTSGSADRGTGPRPRKQHVVPLSRSG